MCFITIYTMVCITICTNISNNRKKQQALQYWNEMTYIYNNNNSKIFRIKAKVK